MPNRNLWIKMNCLFKEFTIYDMQLSFDSCPNLKIALKYVGYSGYTPWPTLKALKCILSHNFQQYLLVEMWISIGLSKLEE